MTTGTPTTSHLAKNQAPGHDLQQHLYRENEAEDVVKVLQGQASVRAGVGARGVPAQQEGRQGDGRQNGPLKVLVPHHLEAPPAKPTKQQREHCRCVVVVVVGGVREWGCWQPANSTG